MGDEASTKSTHTAELSTALTRLGLNQYEERLKENAFEDWETVTAITESDLGELGFKLGDRRKLQRAIREYNSSVSSTYSAKELERIETISPSSPQSERTKRQYRRHPRPDPNAPARPKSAYVLFGEHVRHDPALKGSSFTELAKETGKRWRELSDEERINEWESPAAERLQAYKNELGRYMQTENYRNYQQYLDEFKQGRRNQEAMAPLSRKGSISSNSTDQLPAPFARGRSESTHEESAEMVSPPSLNQFHVESQSRETISPIQSGMEEVRYIISSFNINPRLIRASAFPPENQTADAVQAFIHGTGSLLYFWNPREASNLITSVYQPGTVWAPVHATEVFAMAAVGSYCDGDGTPTELRERFLHIFLCMLSSPSDTSDLRRMRLFACLAICRFMTSIESARRLMCKQLMLLTVMQWTDNQKYPPSTLGDKHLYLHPSWPNCPKNERAIGGVYSGALFSLKGPHSP
jgi:hypothetical protein